MQGGSSSKASDLCLLRSLGQSCAENQLGGRPKKYLVFRVLPFFWLQVEWRPVCMVSGVGPRLVPGRVGSVLVLLGEGPAEDQCNPHP